ncbi:hypothetical protein [Lentzea flaviverrucosa]|uniref:Uncharacterized protein n=1 Tax=Lentzea flaviverrucosa TaxID=200379 RepID=A0A1H9U583_9PSEU|nr:hypothetical protein [Lentzea flaviverrucosa]RDI33306.1 hypothetical protein DFR72_102555 [Lentzea flaviverrucosa]SES04327.1 hypothetical protein SAMN05216195_108302 [Lentzea flaviverrucosa]
MTTRLQAPPRAVRIASALTFVQALGGIALAVALVIRVIGGSTPAGPILGAAGVLVLWFGGALLATVMLFRGHHGARSPVIVTQLLLLGCAWYAYGPSEQPLLGSLGGIYCVVVLVFLFTNDGRKWAMGFDDVSEGDKSD